jgi:multisubunit Na+/H+ antiporter MnhG subunit
MMTLFGSILPFMGAFIVFTGAVYLLAFPPSLTQATTPQEQLRVRSAFVIFNFGTIKCFVAEENPQRSV